MPVTTDASIVPNATPDWSTLPKIGIGIEITMAHGWGIHAYHLAKRIIERRIAYPVAICDQTCPIMLDPSFAFDSYPLSVGGTFQMDRRPDHPIIHGRGNRPGRGYWPYKEGDSLIHVFEDTTLSPQDIASFKGFGPRLITVSNWNATVLRRNGIEAQCAHLGVDTGIFRPRPHNQGSFGEDRFVIFSGGKLELRKGQDIVLAAFKIFKQRHPEALLVTMWYNPWPDTAKSMQFSPYFAEVSSWLTGGLEGYQEIGPIGRTHLAQSMTSFDVALFPNRCEGGTNMIAMECLASGVPTILSSGHGHDDMISYPVPCYALDRSKSSPFPGVNEWWVEPDLEEVVEALEHVYQNRAEARTTGINAAMTMQEWDWTPRMDEQIKALRIGKDDSGFNKALAATKATMETRQVEATAVEYARLAGQLRDAGFRKTAVAVAKRAMTMAPKQGQVVNQYGNMLLTDHQPNQALSFCLQALTLSQDEGRSRAAHNMGLAHLYQGQYDSALREFDKAKDDLEVCYDRAHCLLAMGRWKEGLEAMELRRLHKPENYPKRGMPEWEGQEVDTLWVTTEQGIGDAFMLARFLPWARSRCKKLLFSAHAQTFPMFVGYPGIDGLLLYDPMMPEPQADAHVPMLSLMGLYGARPHHLPPDPGHFTKIASQMTADVTAAPGMHKIGIVWGGNPGHTRDWERSIPLEAFLPLVEKPNLQLFSLQVGRRATDIEAGLSQIIADLSNRLIAWPVTAAVLRGLDALVTCDTAIAHLAGALGVPTYLLLCKMPDWRWLSKRDDTPWYPSVQLVRQKRLGEWGFPLLYVADKLTRMKVK